MSSVFYAYVLLMRLFFFPTFAGTGGPSVALEGTDALLTCVVSQAFTNDTVIWRKGPHEILSAGVNRVTNNKRINILHDDGEYKVYRWFGLGLYYNLWIFHSPWHAFSFLNFLIRQLYGDDECILWEGCNTIPFSWRLYERFEYNVRFGRRNWVSLLV